MPKLGLGLSLPQTRVAGGFTPKKISGLSLWLKADAGVSRFSYNYISRIVLAGGSNGNGTYNASGAPGWDFNNNLTNSYSLGSIDYSNPSNIYTLYLSDGSIISSYDGINWNIDRAVYTGGPTLSGITGDYSGGNGLYSQNGDPWDYSFYRQDGGWTFYIQGSPGYFAFSAYNGDTFFDNLAVYSNGSWVSNVPETASISGGTTGVVLNPTAVPTGTITNTTVKTDTVTGWTDQSQYNHVLSSSLAGQNNPKLVNSFVNGKPVVEFTRDNNEGLSNNDVLLENIFTFFSVTKQKPTNGPGRTFSSYYNNFLIGTWGTEPIAYSNRFFGGDDNGWLVEGENISTDWLITTAYAGSANSFYFNQNNGTPVTGTSEYSLIIDGVSVGGGVANEGGFSEPSDSYIAEIIIYNRVLTTQERQQVEAYLNTKYAIY